VIVAIGQTEIDSWNGKFTVNVEGPGGFFAIITNGIDAGGPAAEAGVQTLVDAITAHPDLTVTWAVLERTASATVTPTP
jgi:hypothetical protein